MNFKSKRVIGTLVGAFSIATLAGLAIVTVDSFDVVRTTATAGMGSEPLPSNRVNQLEKLQSTDNGNVDVVRELAHIAYKQGRYEKAGELYENVFSLEPLDKQSLYFAAKSFYLGGDLNRATALFNSVHLEEVEDAALYRVRLLLANNKLESALQALAEINFSNEQFNGAATLLRADVAFIQKHYSEAEMHYSSLVENEQYAPFAYFGLAQVAQSSGDSEKALSLLDKAVIVEPQLQLGTGAAEMYRMLGEAEKSYQLYASLMDKYSHRSELVVAAAELAAGLSGPEEISRLRASIKGTSSYDLAARHYLDGIKHYLNRSFAKSRLSLDYAESMFGSRALFDYLGLDLAIRLRDSVQFQKYSESLNQSELTPRRKALLYSQLLVFANELLDSGDGAVGLKAAEFAASLTEDNLSATALVMRGQLLTGKFADAINSANSLVSNELFSVIALEVLARAYIEQADYVHAKSTLSKLQNKQPELAVAPYWLGVIAYREQQYSEAERYLNLAAEKGASLKAGALLVDVFLKTQNWRGIERVAKPLVEGEDDFLKGVGYAYLAGGLKAQADYIAAAQSYDRAYSADPSRLLYKLNAFDSYMNAEAFSEARNAITQMLTDRPDNLIVRFKEAYLMQVTQQLSEAESRYRSLLLSNPNWAIVLLNLSELMVDTGRSEEAVTYAKRAAVAAPNWFAAQLNAANLLATSNSSKDALQFAKRAQIIDPDSLEVSQLIEQLDSTI